MSCQHREKAFMSLGITNTVFKFHGGVRGSHFHDLRVGYLPLVFRHLCDKRCETYFHVFFLTIVVPILHLLRSNAFSSHTAIPHENSEI